MAWERWVVELYRDTVPDRKVFEGDSDSHKDELSGMIVPLQSTPLARARTFIGNLKTNGFFTTDTGDELNFHRVDEVNQIVLRKETI